MNNAEYQTKKKESVANQAEHNSEKTSAFDSDDNFDYSFVNGIARIAVYDDPRTPPHIIEIQPAPTAEYIENIASTVNREVKQTGGKIPYSAIREVTENFIHARFQEIVVSIMDSGNTIRFTDQGPGIEEKEEAQLPGFTSAIEPMKRYIRGVGSGLPSAKEWVEILDGHITIQDNLHSGAVVTISVVPEPAKEPLPVIAPEKTIPLPPLSEREKQCLLLFANEGALGVSDVSTLTSIPPSSTHGVLRKLEESNLIEKTLGKKRILTQFGYDVVRRLK